MRTTLRIDDDVLLALQERARRERRSAGEVLSELARPALTDGFVRILSPPRYPSPVPASQAVGLLDDARSGGHHVFWACDISLLDAGVVDPLRLDSPRQVTDAYLLALAVAHDGRLVSFDQRVPLAAVRGTTDAHCTSWADGRRSREWCGRTALPCGP